MNDDYFTLVFNTYKKVQRGLLSGVLKLKEKPSHIVKTKVRKKYFEIRESSIWPLCERIQC